ncbi:large subunit ribosomal protein L3 [Geomicrobium halophilum]|uniref:Large ribosomal subunit protein uL3 n=1 Tax=Geomicrobium halophilum TaxID=549000 RepID=A0A841PXL2_9BACL|nr:50S ribosomal protein L3 [Geomicrobium halophilum]MBB6451461.1 large subunit ribosomal protein L3 [Geomicrobium halophilum]
MAKGILGRKIGMTQVFSENGDVVPVTVVQAEPNIVMQLKSQENDGYDAVQLGVDDKKEQRSNKPEKGHADKASTAPKRYVREFRDMNLADHEIGQEVSVNTFEPGDIIDVTGVSKGKGFQGSIKRHNYSIGPKSHGSRYHRGSGAMGAIDLAHVPKGNKLPGQMGGNQVTVQNLEVVQVDSERELLLIKGNVPGAKKSYVKVQSTVKTK